MGFNGYEWDITSQLDGLYLSNYLVSGIYRDLEWWDSHSHTTPMLEIHIPYGKFMEWVGSLSILWNPDILS